MFNPNLFSERFLIKSIRLPNCNYANVGYYFVTICTRNKKNYFGKIINGKMTLSDMGKIAENCWQQIPNHVHGIIHNQLNFVRNYIKNNPINWCRDRNNHPPMKKH